MLEKLKNAIRNEIKEWNELSEDKKAHEIGVDLMFSQVWVIPFGMLFNWHVFWFTLIAILSLIIMGAGVCLVIMPIEEG